MRRFTRDCNGRDSHCRRFSGWRSSPPSPREGGVTLAFFSLGCELGLKFLGAGRVIAKTKGALGATMGHSNEKNATVLDCMVSGAGHLPALGQYMKMLQSNAR